MVGVMVRRRHLSSNLLELHVVYPGQPFAGEVSRRPKAMATLSAGTSKTTSYRCQSVVPLIGPFCMLSKLSEPCCWPSTRIHNPAQDSMPSDLTQADKRMRLFR